MSFRRILRKFTGRSPSGLGGAGVAKIADRYPEYDIGTGSYGDLRIIHPGPDAQFSMGKYCSVASGVTVLLQGEHRADWITTYPFSLFDPRHAHISGHPRAKGDVVIGNDVWLGREAMIMSGVNIGDGAIVAGRAVVVADVPPYAIVGGNPAKFIRTRFSEDVIERLLQIRWWDWPEERLAASMPLMLSNDIGAFLDAAERGEI